LSKDGKKHLHREAGWTLTRILGALTNESHAIGTRPISRGRLEIEADNAATGHRAAQRTIHYHDRRRYQQSCGVDHVAKPIKMTLHGEELLCPHSGGGFKRVAGPPCKVGIRGYRDLVAVAQIQLPRVRILRAPLNKIVVYKGDGHAQWLTAKNQEISAVLQVRQDRLPAGGRYARAVRQDQKLCVLERSGRLQSLHV
jgi:hypothetical protein